MDKIKRVKELVIECNKYRDEYYNQNNPSVSDKEYDLLFDELKSLENETGFILSNSPTQSVGYKVVSELNKVEHSIPLLSLDKTKSIDDIKKFVGDKQALLMFKYDGLTVELIYEDGALAQASTRGDGYIGEDITHNAKTFKNLPLTIPYKGYLKIVGEAIIHTNDFAKINSSLPGEEKYKTPRNLVSGSVRQLDSKICDKRNVYFYPWDVLEGLDDVCGNYRLEKLNMIVKLGFAKSEFLTIAGSNDYKYLDEMIKRLTNVANKFFIPIDGLVVKYDDIEFSKSLGSTSHHNNDGIAFKFEDETEKTILRDIEWSIGRTGVLTPVAIFDTVVLDGTEVTRASLHNISIIEKLKLGIGDIVSVAKMNMIIPQIVENYTKSNNIQIPQECPVCKGLTEIVQEKDSEVLKCKNPNCNGKILGKFVHFVSKPAMNIEGLSEATLVKFINKGWLKSFSDIYKLDKHKDKIIQFEGFGQKSYEKLWSAIQKSRNVKLNNFLVALGIPLIGKTAAKTLSEYFDYEWYEIEAALNDGFDFTRLKDFGQTMADSLMNWYKSEGYYELDSLMPYLNLVKPQTQNTTDSLFNGKKIYCTGTFANFKKDELKELVSNLGAEFASGYAKSLDYLVVGSIKGSSKEGKAQKDGVKILTEDEFIKMIGGV